MDVGEAPDEALHREIWEETAQEVTLGDLLTVVTGHWVGRSPSGVVQDFHAVRLVYRATCAAPSDPRVIEVGGSTEAAGWFSAQKLAQLPVVDSWADVLPQVTGVVPTSW
jgi:ADP-ribose pyrophosphatase YjhB (NUDIX family)